MTVLSGIDPNALAAVNVSGVLSAGALGNGGMIFGTGTSTIGTITWTGYAQVGDYHPNPDPKKSGTSDRVVNISISGTLTKNSTQRPIGRITMKASILVEKSASGTPTALNAMVASVGASDGVLDTLVDAKPLNGFWATIPACDTLSGPVIQSIWDNAAAQARLYRLTTSLEGQ
jgi:hypothetical protein